MESATERQMLERQGQERVCVAITFWHQQRFDPDNLVGAAKPILDALRRVRYIRNDDREWLDLRVEQRQALPRKTVIEIEKAA